MNKKFIRNFGKQLKKSKTWEKATDVSSKILINSGKGVALVSAATLQPEGVAFGEGLIGAGNIAKKTSKLLKKTNKK